mmetsp:Transcript_17342/g.28804  ORF Transcript_17342/g.28804 Transcript_17342/m.28804 type:complete len:506 (-) Transcript_17342:59-1576(-)|eukprot:CAMPEP_0119008184 /NCGR_PEP_ID=MMETSP1176-20130426/3517_1 /TAXON_ID=265551 /ORGANISM="Synedropsis recta cf, Strain CCMP1620" /LENGTH=505 /DNA_ID=CAMNT_0006960469 /DNA_START=32 /DNA_END=1549 /DNA_ORIENTATION=-
MFKDLVLFTATAVASVALSKLDDRQIASPPVKETAAPRSVLIATDALKDGTSLNNTEHVCTVSEDNAPTPHGHSRKEMRLQNLWHRATYVIVKRSSNKQGDDDVQILVQQRSLQKDYCPGRWDPTPGGVVGFGESYRENSMRELEEEMGIAPQELKRLFTFPYEDERVKVWGELFEVEHAGEIRDLVLQECEVDHVMAMTLTEIKESMAVSPEKWMPDARHAMQLYLQYRQDHSLKRRFLRSFSSDADAYKVRPKPQVVFFDCDDCLYFDNWKVAELLTKKINGWCVSNGLEDGKAYQLYKQYGTALKGLVSEGYIDGSIESIDEFLKEVHDIQVMDHLDEDNHLRDLLLNMDPSIPKYIFTASVRHHAERCLKALGIDDLFVDIIDVKACNFETKHSEESFQAAMRIAGVSDPEACVFLDDSVKNIRAAHRVGWRSILVGRVERDTGKPIDASDHAEHEIDVIHDFPKALPELFAHMDEEPEPDSQQKSVSSDTVALPYEQGLN